MEKWKWGVDSSENFKQKIAKKLKNWEEFVAKKQIEHDKQKLTNCPCIKRGILRLWASYWLKFRVLENEVHSLSDAREFYDPESREQLWSDPTFPPRRDSGLSHDTQNFTGTSRNVFERPPAQEGRPSTFFNNSKPLFKKWDLILKELHKGRRVKWKENRWTRRSLHHISKVEVVCWIVLVDLILTVVWWIIRDFRFRNCIWENFLTLWNFKAGKSTSRLKFVRKDQILISHALDQRSWDGEVKWRTSDITIDCGANRFPTFRCAWCDDCVCIEETSRQHSHFHKRVGVEEQRAQTFDRFLRERQIAYMIYEHFRATGAYEAVQGLSNLFSKSLQNDDVQDFDVSWDQALLSVSEMPSDVILEGLYKS